MNKNQKKLLEEVKWSINLTKKDIKIRQTFLKEMEAIIKIYGETKH